MSPSNNIYNSFKSLTGGPPIFLIIFVLVLALTLEISGLKHIKVFLMCVDRNERALIHCQTTTFPVEQGDSNRVVLFKAVSDPIYDTSSVLEDGQVS